jgi:hypothetical protein
MKIPIWDPSKIQNGLVWVYSNREKYDILGFISRNFENFKGGKWTLDLQSIKLYSIDICSKYQSKQYFLEKKFPSFC